jgi:ATP-dependent DNA helicase RecQ
MDCGICNNCLDKKQSAINKPEFESIHQKIKGLLHDGPLHHKLFLGQLSDIKKEKAWEVINFLQAENKIEILPDGMIQWVK